MNDLLTPEGLAQARARAAGLLGGITRGGWAYGKVCEDAVRAGDLHTPILRADMTPYSPNEVRRAEEKVANLKLAASAADLAAQVVQLCDALAAARTERAYVLASLKAVDAKLLETQEKTMASLGSIGVGVMDLERRLKKAENERDGLAARVSDAIRHWQGKHDANQKAKDNRSTIIYGAVLNRAHDILKPEENADV